MDLGALVVLILISLPVIAFAVFISAANTSERKRNLENHLARIADFSATQKVMGAEGNTGLAVDDQRMKVCLIDGRQNAVSIRVVSWKDLLSSEIFVDGETVTRTSRSSQIGGALIGGLVLGGVGAIVGGLSGKTQTSGRVSKIDLRLTVNDTVNPIHDVNFLAIESKKDSFRYEQAMEQVRHWHGLIDVFIKRADMEDASHIKSNADQIERKSIADEIKKLAELRDSGALSVDEFQQQKARILES